MKNKTIFKNFSEPLFRRKFKCLGCGGRTKLSRLWEECGQCHGDGYIESDDLFFAKNGYEKCFQCNVRGGWYFWDKYCGQDCYDHKMQDDYEDFQYEEELYWERKAACSR